MKSSAANLDFFQILENLQAAVCVIALEDNSNFKIEYLNKCFIQTTQNLIPVDQDISVFSSFFDSEWNWKETATLCLERKTSTEKQCFFSPVKTFFKVRFSLLENNKLLLLLEDISGLKEKDLFIKKQNLRLEQLARDLNLSRNELKRRLNSIEMLNSQLRSAAYHDALTNLNNRFLYKTHVMDAARIADEKNWKFAVVLFDVDNIKVINDAQGANAGDHVLQTIARELRRMENQDTTAYRMNGDDFILLKQNLTDRNQIITLTEDLKKRLNEKDIYISGGIVIYPEDSKNAGDLHTFADMAKSEAKKTGKNSIKLFKQVMQEKFISKVNIESKMTKAMDNNLFQLYFQPQFDAATNELRGFEALIRWYDKDLGWISPEEFIPLAEESNLVIPIGDWVMEKGMDTLEEWEKKYGFDGILSINVSPVQFAKEDFLSKFKEKLLRHKINPAHLEVEITEGILIHDVEAAVHKLNEIKELGSGISLDDFGTGYSSLRYLQILPLTTLKIDKSFISNINNKTGTEAHITESIVSMVSKMGLDTIAEGVETEEQLNILKQINCKNIQGFLKGKPMPKETCDKLLSGDISAVVSLEEEKHIFVKPEE